MESEVTSRATPNRDQFAEVKAAWMRLDRAVMKNCNERYCIRLWSRFIRLRDGSRCVACHSTRRIAAHHILRKSFLGRARFQTGNGITLCADCHAGVHADFNRKPDLNQPMDAEGGDNNDDIARFFAFLLEDAVEREMNYLEFYFLSEEVLRISRLLQGFSANVSGPGSPLQQAYLIWNFGPPQVRDAILIANGLPPFGDAIFPPGIRIRSLEHDTLVGRASRYNSSH